MPKSIGLDLVDVNRIRSDLDRWGERFASRVLGGHELALFRKRVDKPLFLAGRFAAKEAVIKGLGQYLTDKPPLTDIQIINDPSGRPQLLLPERIHTLLPNVNCLISISHEKQFAAAVALFVENQ